VVHKNFSGHVSVFLRAQVWLAEREYSSGKWVALVRPGTDEIKTRRGQQLAAVCQTGNVFQMTTAELESFVIAESAAAWAGLD